MNGFLTGKRILITGVASKRSIAAGIAGAMHAQGAELAFTYPNDKMRSRVEDIAGAHGSDIILPCDVAEDTDIEALFSALGEQWDGLDGLIHSIGFAPREQLDGGFLDCLTREGYQIAHDISAYSFAALGKAARPMMEGRNAALLTLSYLGADRVLPNYNVMGPAKASLEACVRFMAADLGPQGHRVNAISAGPIKTLAAAGISGFRNMQTAAAETAPLRRNVSQEEVGNVAAFLCSDLASGVTGETLFVDAGYNVMGLAAG